MTQNSRKDFSNQRFETIIAVVIVLAIIAIGILVEYKFYFLYFFFIPVIFSGYYLGRKRAILIAVSCILLEMLYLVFSRRVFGIQFQFSRDDQILLLTWAVFLVITAWIVGLLSEKREKELYELRRAYTGVLAIVLKYLEVGEEGKSTAEKVAELAGRMAEVLEMSKAEVENIKSAALLSDIEDLPTCLPLFNKTSQYMEKESLAKLQLNDREKIMLKTAALILSEVHPLLESYYLHYRQKVNEVENNLASIPLGTSIMALAELYVRMGRQGKARIGSEEVSSLDDIRKLKGRYFPEKVVEALLLVAF